MKRIFSMALLILSFVVLAQPVIIGVDEYSVKLNSDDSKLPLPLQTAFKKLDEMSKDFTEKAEKRWKKCFKEEKDITNLGSFYSVTILKIQTGNKKLPQPVDCVECEKKKLEQEAEESMSCLMNHNKKIVRKMLEVPEFQQYMSHRYTWSEEISKNVADYYKTISKKGNEVSKEEMMENKK